MSANTRIRFEGEIVTWNDERGFGFIAPDQGGQQIFLHVKSMARRSVRPHAGQRVTFAVEPGPGGKKRAAEVMVRVDRVPPSVRVARRAAPVRWSVASLAALPLFAGVWVACAMTWGVPFWMAGAYAVASIACFFAYAFDKAAAQAGRWRTPESTLLVLGLAGGWPGGLLAQQLLRHKSSKAPFRAAFWITVGLNVAGFVAWCWRG
jgi:uncharacterized membrane protein YsdA (DUF1294 family)/cold shock CspA family protein